MQGSQGPWHAQTHKQALSGSFPQHNPRSSGVSASGDTPLGSVPMHLGQEVPLKKASGFPCREESKPLWVGENGWGELGPKEAQSRQGPHCQYPQTASSPSAGDRHHCPLPPSAQLVHMPEEGVQSQLTSRAQRFG